MDYGGSINLSLGDNPAGFTVGSIFINPGGPGTVTPALIQSHAFDSDITNVASGTDIGQVLAPQALFDVVSNSACQFDINVYDTNNFTDTLSQRALPIYEQRAVCDLAVREPRRH